MVKDKHEVTFLFSGSWKEKQIAEDGENEFKRPYDHNPELTVEAECSCGKEFQSAIKALEHLDDVKEKQ